MELLLFPLLMLAAMWLIIIRPQKRRLAERERLLAALSSGDRVVTAGGIHGTIRSIDAEQVQLEVADGVIMTFARRAIAEIHRDDAASGNGSEGAARPEEDER